MIKEEILDALGCLTNGAINYYQTPNEVLLKDKIIINYIENLQQELTNYKERNEKAIEYIKRFDFERLHECCEHNLVETLEYLLEILDKKDKE